MRLKIIACKYTVFIQNRIPARLFFSLFLVCHFRDELNTYQTNFFFSEVIPQFIKCIINLVCRILLKIIVDVKQMIFIHDLFQEVINIQFGSGIDNCFYFIQQFSKFNTFG